MFFQTVRYGVAIAVLLGLAQPSLGGSFYVDCSQSSEGNGSRSHPFSSLAKVNEAILNPGDSLEIKAGTTCIGTLSPKGSGTQSSPIYLTSYGDGALPIINGSGAEEAVRLTNQNYWDISKISVINPASTIAWRRGIAAISEDGNVHRGLYIHDVTVYNVAGETNKATQSAAFIASAGIIVNGTENGSRYDDVRIYDNTIYDCGGGGIKVRVGQMNNRGAETHIWGNNVSNVGGDGIVVSYGISPMVEKNVCGFLGHGKYPYTGGNFAGIWVLGCEDAVMRFNVVHDSLMSDVDSEAFDCDWGNEGTCTVEYNYSHDNAGGIFLNCDGCGTAGGATQIVRYNIFQNDCRMYSNGDDVQLEFYNNVVYCPDKQFEISVPPHTNLSNNIWVGTANSTLPTGAFIEWNTNLFQTVAMPLDTAGSTGNPQFTNPGTGKDSLDSVNGYQLRSGSPALESGIFVTDNGGHDFWNNIVSTSSSSKPNIGAYNGRGL
ncbi:pectin lyase fold/virulence factor [Penicillium macrosclerotiorum]|uniref:pectin lyase fold/virulence factor n=1 Tax=Penicillium macrosclerotiorum TaxID=303699 RepID=UPI0025498244|nr:pectin lyase fold/virulence factor [Penicillium macrosclerotiorum]KAJ5692988.1 pectin lyase fold/virulence factor [Penicillium macrosclerotiorum]